jgi:hypothetical protein
MNITNLTAEELDIIASLVKDELIFWEREETPDIQTIKNKAKRKRREQEIKDHIGKCKNILQKITR